MYGVGTIEGRLLVRVIGKCLIEFFAVDFVFWKDALVNKMYEPWSGLGVFVLLDNPTRAALLLPDVLKCLFWSWSGFLRPLPGDSSNSPFAEPRATTECEHEQKGNLIAIFFATCLLAETVSCSGSLCQIRLEMLTGYRILVYGTKDCRPGNNVWARLQPCLLMEPDGETTLVATQLQLKGHSNITLTGYPCSF